MLKRSHKIIIGAVVGVIALGGVIVAGLMMPAQTDNGLDNFKGVEREAAEHALVHAREMDDKRIAMVYRVEKVRREEHQNCQYIGKDDPNDIGHYAVTVRQIGPFWYGESIEYSGCVLVMTL